MESDMTFQGSSSVKWLYRRLEDFRQAQFDMAYASLSPARKERIDRLHRPQDKHRSLAGEILVKELAEQFAIFSPVVDVLPSGQPTIANGDLFISIAHCRDFIVSAADTQPIGIDTEQLRPFRSGLLKHVCNDRERAYVLGDTPPLNGLITDPGVVARFFEVWTAKEAWFKKTGTGITDLRSADVLPMQRQIFLVDDFMIQIV